MTDVMSRVHDHLDESLQRFDTEVDTLLDDVQYNIVKSALKGEILSD